MSVVSCSAQNSPLLLVEYRDAFALFDKRGDGKIDSDQIGDIMRALGLNPTEADVKKIIAGIDPTGVLTLASCSCVLSNVSYICSCREQERIF